MDISLDMRVQQMRAWRAMPVTQSLPLLYPRLAAIHTMTPEVRCLLTPIDPLGWEARHLRKNRHALFHKAVVSLLRVGRRIFAR